MIARTLGKVRTRPLVVGLLAAGAWCASGCGGGVEPYKPGGSGGGASGSGGAGMLGTGGAPSVASGGNSAPGSGGGPASSTGGRAAASGGAPGSGGAVATGSGGASSSGSGVLLPLPWADDFEAATTGSVPMRWLADPSDAVGKWAVAVDGTSKVLQETVTVSSVSWIVGGDRNWADQKVEAKVKFSAVTSASLALVAARFVNLDDYYFLHLKGDGSLKIRKRILVGSSTSTVDVLSYKSGTALTAGTWYTVAIEIKGNSVTAYLNGVAVGTMVEAAVSIAKGGIALGFQDAAGSFDDVKVTAP